MVKMVKSLHGASAKGWKVQNIGKDCRTLVQHWVNLQNVEIRRVMLISYGIPVDFNDILWIPYVFPMGFDDNL